MPSPKRKPRISKKDYDFSGILALRQLLSNEKARILHVIKTQSPTSIYDLSKKLDRTFKSVNDDLKLLERFGFIELIEEKTKKRRSTLKFNKLWIIFIPTRSHRHG